MSSSRPFIPSNGGGGGISYPSISNLQQQQQQSTSNGSSHQLNSAPEDPLFGPLERAGIAVNDQLTKELSLAGIGGLADGLQGTSSSSYTLPQSPAFNPFQLRRTYPIPDGLFQEWIDDEAGGEGHSCLMGIFPEIERAWMTVDNKLFLWDFQRSNDFTRFDELPLPITHISLIPTKKNVFVDSISHLLLIATATTITLLGLSLSKDGEEIELYQTDLSIPLLSLQIRQTVATPSGRTFCLGSDGVIYELLYRSSEGWFTKKASLKPWTGSGGSVFGGLVPDFLKSGEGDPVVKLALDETRNVLYALTASHAVELYTFGPPTPSNSSTLVTNTDFNGASISSSPVDDTPLVKIHKMTEILRAAVMLSPNTPSLDTRSFSILNLTPVPVSEGGSSIHLIATTSKGVRLYFSYYRRNIYSSWRPSNGPPTGLELLHVRLPPVGVPVDLTLQLAPGQAMPVEQTMRFAALQAGATGAFKQGVWTGSEAFGPQGNGGNDMEWALWVCPSPSTIFNRPPVQQQQSQQPQQRAYGNQPQPSQPGSLGLPLSEILSVLQLAGQSWAISEAPFNPPVSSEGARRGLSLWNDGLGGPNRRWYVLTSEGMHLVIKKTGVDVLRGVIEEGRANGWEGVVENFGRDLACALCLALATSDAAPLSATSASNLSSSSTTPHRDQLSSSLSAPPSSDLIMGAKKLFYEFGGRPEVMDVRVNGPSGSQVERRVIFSSKYEGLVVFFSSVVREVWRSRIVNVNPSTSLQSSALSESTLLSVQSQLLSLSQFLDRNSQLFQSIPSEYNANPALQLNSADAWKKESAALEAMRSLIKLSIEGISFVLLLNDWKLGEVMSKCDSALQKDFAALTYSALLTTKNGREVARQIVNAVIYQQIGQQVSIDTISEILQQRCGSFCRADDVILFKAIENMRKAKETRDDSERRECLAESLRLFSKGAQDLPIDQLREYCVEYRLVHFPAGAIELPLKCAQNWDASKQGIAYWNDGEQLNDPRLAAFEKRMGCYRIVFETLEALDDMVEKEAASNSHKSGDSSNALRLNAYNQALSSDDILFHVSLYDWLLERNLTDQLLEIRTPFIEKYLSREPVSHAKSELLWQYHVRNGNYFEAALVQAALAQTDTLQLSLVQRLEYLTLAVSNAKSQPSSRAASVEFLTDLEEKMDVAQVQLEVYRTVSEIKDMEAEVKRELLERLDERLLTISELYMDFAEPFHLLECILLILHTSDHRDASLVSQVWDEIITQAADARGYEKLTAKIIDLGRRFYPSEIAFPLDFLCRTLEAYAYESRSELPTGWLATTLREAGVEYQRIFEEYYLLFDEKMAPWGTDGAALFLADDIGLLLTSWLSEWRSQNIQSRGSSNRFPLLLQVEEFVSVGLLPLMVSLPESDPRKMRLRSLLRTMGDL